MVFEFDLIPSGTRIVFSDKATSVSLSFNGEPVDYYDREGRLIGTYEDGHHYRRGLDNRLLEKYREDGGRQRIRMDVMGARKRRIIENTYDRAAQVFEAVESGQVSAFRPQGLGATVNQELAHDTLTERLSPVANTGYERLIEDSEHFRGIYAPVSILPPDQYLALIVQMTIGCSYNKCTFCDFYRDRPFSIKSPEELRAHIENLLGFFGESAWLRRSMFLLDGNALVIPQRKLMERLDVVHEFFAFAPVGADRMTEARWMREHPHGFDGLYAFLDAFSSLKKPVDEWRELRDRHVRRVYIGLESGDDGLLEFIRKPGDRATTVDAARTIREAGVRVGVIAMVGVGGDRYTGQHVRNTIDAINSMELGEGDIVYLSDFVNHPGLPYESAAREQGIRDLTWEETAAQRDEIKQGLRFSDPKRPPKVAQYDIREMIY